MNCLIPQNLQVNLMNDYSAQRTTMVDCQIRPSDVTDFSIISAMLEIPREKFVSESQAQLAYRDEDLPLRDTGSAYPRCLMEPAPFARLLQLAEIQSGAIVLDIGCASGYSTAVLARLCSSVVALEEDKRLAARATQILSELEVDNAVVVTGPLVNGYAKEGPFDVIFIGGAVGQIPDTLAEQLKEGGKLVAVEGTGNTGKATLYVREDENLCKFSHFNCAVWPLPGFEKQVEFEF